jgi:hypothetical protein
VDVGGREDEWVYCSVELGIVAIPGAVEVVGGSAELSVQLSVELEDLATA